MDNSVIGTKIETKTWQTITKLIYTNGEQQWVWYGVLRQQFKYVN